MQGAALVPNADGLILHWPVDGRAPAEGAPADRLAQAPGAEQCSVIECPRGQPRQSFEGGNWLWRGLSLATIVPIVIASIR